MGVGLQAKSQLGLLPYTIEPRIVGGIRRRFAKIKCDHKDCTHEDETAADAVGRPLPLEFLNKKFTERGWHVRRHHNRCPEHNGKVRAGERKVLHLATVPERFKHPVVADPVGALEDTTPIKAKPSSLSHIHESKVSDLSEAQQLQWYKQAYEREQRRADRYKRENTDILKAFRSITNVARKQFSGLGDVWSGETSWADNRSVSLNLNFALIKDAVRIVEGS